MEQIKVGDKVRVSKTIPNMYLVGFGYAVFGDECKVREIDEGNVLIKWKDNYITIPAKYLIKVNAEPKFSKGDKVSYCGELYVVTNITVVGRERNIHYTIERDYDKSITSVAERFLKPYAEPKKPKFEVGDIVRIKPNAAEYHKGYQNGYAWLPNRDIFVGKPTFITNIRTSGDIELKISGENITWNAIDLVLYSEAKEQIEKPVESISEETANELSDIIEAHTRTLRTTEDNFDWRRYEADLAKEIAVKMADTDCHADTVGWHAVKIAKSVVENLKEREL